jgi:hypothetical protein
VVQLHNYTKVQYFLYVSWAFWAHKWSKHQVQLIIYEIYNCKLIIVSDVYSRRCQAEAIMAEMKTITDSSHLHIAALLPPCIGSPALTYYVNALWNPPLEQIGDAETLRITPRNSVSWPIAWVGFDNKYQKQPGVHFHSKFLKDSRLSQILQYSTKWCHTVRKDTW